MRSQDWLPFRLLTHNIRYATDNPFPGEKPWPIRAPRMINELRFNTAHCGESFICLQEVLHEQLVGILAGLNRSHKEEWDFIGVGRDDGNRAGEYSPIFYRPSVWALRSWETVWLSETPDIPSKSWDAASVRILTIGFFQHRRSKKKLVVMNTHLDDQGVKSRYEAVQIILGRISERSQQGTLPVLLAGDFNSQPSDDAYRTLTRGGSSMQDVQDVSFCKGLYGHRDTFTGFGGDDKTTRIDFLFVNRGSYPWDIQGYGVLENKFDDEIYISDHRAVVADVAV
ncbi:MAG: hypothetical protein Q9201_002654 [Fulgogasparrea decipioides]